jgi:hypothetical protein
VTENDSLRGHASAVVRSFLTNLVKKSHAGFEQKAFDEFHEAKCNQLCSTYRDGGFPHFRLGQAQKWLNMALKYVFLFGEDKLPGFDRVFALAHVPMDRVMLECFQKRWRIPKPPTAWSQLDDYAEYLNWQNQVRDRFRPSIPLAVEFHLWLNPEIVEPVSNGNN